jgi:hypothetical protein
MGRKCRTAEDDDENEDDYDKTQNCRMPNTEASAGFIVWRFANPGL